MTSYKKGHNRSDTVTQKLFLTILHTVAWNTVMTLTATLKWLLQAVDSSRQN